jgi:hypothetical protein
MTDANWKTYRHSRTGLIQRLHEQTAAVDPNLVEVDEDAKPLAFTPIDQAAIEEVVDAQPQKRSDTSVGKDKE